MISFFDITFHTFETNVNRKQQRILIQLKKKEQYEGLTLFTLEKEIAIFIDTRILHSNDNNSIFISNVFSAPTKEQTIINKESIKNSDNNELQIAHQHPLDETHIVTVRGFIH